MSSENLGIGIKVDPGDAAAKAKAVTDALHKTEDAGIAAGRSMAGLGGAFGKLREALEQERSALERCNATHRQLTSTMAAAGAGFAQVAKAIEQERAAAERCREVHEKLVSQGSALQQSLGGISQAIQHEADMLERIHGPARQFAQDVMTLDRLLQQGRINAEQYAAALAKMGVSYEQAAQGAQHMTAAQRQQATQMIGLPNAPTTHGMGLTPGKALGVAGAVVGGVRVLEDARQASNDTQDEFTRMRNAAQKLADEEGRKLNDVIDEQADLAHKLHQSFHPTIALYDDIGDATEKLGLTHREHIKLMERLGKAAIVEGKEIGHAGEFMKKLSINMDAGRDSGRLLVGMMNDMPNVTKVWVEKYGGDTKAFIAAVEDGKESYASLVDQIIVGSDQIETAFSRVRRSHAAKATDIREEIIRSQNMGRGKDALGESTAALISRGQQRQRGELNIDRSSVLGAIGDAKRRATTAATAAADRRSAEAFDATLSTLSGTVKDLGVQAELTGDQLDRKFNAALDDTSTSAGHAAVAVDEYEEAMKRIRGPQEDAARQLNILNNLYMNGRIELEELRREEERYRNVLIERGKIEIPSITGGAIQRMDMTIGNQWDSFVEPPGVDDYTKDLKTPEPGHKSALSDEEFEAAFGERQTDMEKALSQEKKAHSEAAQHVKEAWAGAAGSVIGDFLKMAMEGKKSASEIGQSMMRSLALAGLQVGAQQMGGVGGSFLSALAGGLGGGANGFDYVASSRRTQLPGFGSGGDAMTMGSGGTDSKLAVFKITPGESLSVRTPPQQMAEAQWRERAEHAMSLVAAMGSGGGQRPINATYADPSELAYAAHNTYAGQRAASRYARRRVG